VPNHPPLNCRSSYAEIPLPVVGLHSDAPDSLVRAIAPVGELIVIEVGTVVEEVRLR
jgi:hypothetical protein